MPRPKNAEPRHFLQLSIRESVHSRVESALNEGKAFGRRRKLGDYSDLVTILLLRWLSSVEEPLSPLELEEL